MVKSKDPAVLWYWGDWNSGTATLSRFLKGAYMDLLHAQFNSGPLSLEEIKTVLSSDFGAAWPTLIKKFTKNPDGLFFNERLEAERLKRRAFTKSRVDNLNGKKTHMENHMDTHMATHMENVNESKNEVKGERKVRKPSGDVREYHDTTSPDYVPPEKRQTFKPPTFQEFQAYCIENGCGGIAARAFKGYADADWHDSGGKKVKNWKQKLQHVWFDKKNLDSNARVTNTVTRRDQAANSVDALVAAIQTVQHDQG